MKDSSDKTYVSKKYILLPKYETLFKTSMKICIECETYYITDKETICSCGGKLV